MSKRTIRRAGTAALAAGALAAAMIGAGGAAQAAPTSTTMTCGSLNPLFWQPSFTWDIRAASGWSAPPDGPLEPAILLSGGNELPVPPGGLLPSIGVNWYGTQVLVDWHNRTTGQSGRSVSNQEAWQQHPRIPINRTWSGTGTVDITVTVQTGAGWWFVNTQNAVCRGTIDVVN